MKIFIDTANIQHIKEANSLGVIDGVTTNPSLMAKEGLKNKDEIKRHFEELCKLNIGSISVEVLSTTCNEMVHEARELAKIHKNIVVKIPAIEEGLKTIKTLTKDNIRTNCTLIFNEFQALLAMKAGATYISPFIGRLEDEGIDGVGVIENILHIRKTYNLTSEVICTSIRNNYQIKRCLMAGADIVTCPLDFIKNFIKHPKTEKGLEIFLSDFANQM